MKGKILTLFLLVALILPVQTFAASPEITVMLDGTKIQFDVKPQIINSRTMVPVAKIFQALNTPYTWDQATFTVTATKNDTTIILTIGANVAYVNGSPIKLDSPAKVVNSRTLVPLSFISQSLGYEVKWDASTWTASILSKGDAPLKELTSQQNVEMNDEKVVLIETPKSIGSGVVIKNGLIVTNYHVVNDVDSAIIHTIDGQQFTAEGIVVYDENTDLAVLKIKETMNITPVRIGSPAKSKKADQVLAIGSPEGLQNTVSEGIISGFRTEDGVNFIQISVPITHGSSGGGLFNKSGQLIGITTSGLSHGALDLNFAVSIDHLMSWMEGPLSKPLNQIEASFPTAAVTEQILDSASIPTSIGDFELSGFHVNAYDDVVFVNYRIDPLDYHAYITNFDVIKEELKDWAILVGQEIESNYPDTPIVLIIFYQDFWAIYPSTFDPSEIVQTDGGWIVTHELIIIDTIDHRYQVGY